MDRTWIVFRNNDLRANSSGSKPFLLFRGDKPITPGVGFPLSHNPARERIQPRGMLTNDFDYELPEQLIAQAPARQRDASRLLVLHRRSGEVQHRPVFGDLLEYLAPGDALVLNDSKVIPARVRGERLPSGTERNRQAASHVRTQFELLLLEETASNEWWTMVRPGKKARVGTRIRLHPGPSADEVTATVLATNDEGHRLVRFEGVPNILDLVNRIGEVPLPPYIRREGHRLDPEDRERYQTVYADRAGSVAAPTAGLHFTSELLEKIRSRGVRVLKVTLHVGLGTFAPVKADDLKTHRMHEERFEIGGETVRALEETRATGGRVFAVGTTSLRVLESASVESNGRLLAGTGRTRLFVHPPYRFRVVDALVTNFHLPKSTLLMLVSAFASPGGTEGIRTIRGVYASAIEREYRFFSYGDAMLIL